MSCTIGLFFVKAMNIRLHELLGYCLNGLLKGKIQNPKIFFADI